MARHIDEGDDEPREEGPGIVGRLFQRGVSAPNVAMKIFAEQMSGWKKDFLGIFQAEIRHFLDRQNAGEEIRKLIEGKKLEVSIRLVDDDDAHRTSKKTSTSVSAEKPAAAAKKPPRAKKR